MFAPLHRLSVRNRIWSIVLIFIGGTVLGITIDVLMLKQTLRQEKEATIRQVVESAYGVLAHYRDLQQDGILSREAAQAAAISTIKGMRYNGGEYFWINDNQTPARMVMHPLMPELDGQPLLDEKFNCVTSLRSGSDGPFVFTDGKKHILQAVAEVVGQTGHGYVTYLWPKAQAGGSRSQQGFPKLSYVKEFAPWGWIVGSGIYIDDIDAAVRARATLNLLLLLGMSTALLLLTSLIARSITRPLQATMQTMHGIAKGNAGLEQRVPVEGRSEIAELASNFNQMLDHIQARDRALLRHQEVLEEEVSSRTASLREANIKLDAELSERKRQETILQENFERVRSLNKQLEDAQNQLLQSERMASIGQLAAGVAHEINNPIGFVSSNLGTLKEYIDDLLGIIQAYEKADPLLASQPEINSVIAALKKQADLGFLRKDIGFLLGESRQGIERVTKIVQNLKDFSRIDSSDWAAVNLEDGLDSTLDILANEITGKADIVKEYGGLPSVECLGSQLNQVFVILLGNAAQAIESHGTITIRTGSTEANAWIEIADTGKGISPENIKRIFDPFFTTKAVGKGTGLGLSLAYSIVQKHHGKLAVVSEVGVGTCFRIEIPCVQPNARPGVTAPAAIAETMA
ncbi:cache domain-containing protein [Dechloromonas denitrificans]|uniref:cache domain-containing protein n=1 Tax=Dechloromonas denitrificans TaxID=281362 RepID=UPI001CFB44BA|nr:cache domain-containing protein [Dechloromonas denitrificans]UCV06942.1 cache domain-containing protein [Dechloromonas denitrificans]